MEGGTGGGLQRRTRRENRSSRGEVRRPAVARAAFSLIVILLGAGHAGGDPLEPPPESPDGEDYEVEAADSLDDDRVEVSLGASGRGGDGPRHTRRVRFSGDSLGGSLREGAGDPLAGGALEGKSGRGAFGMGKLSPRWGRGLIVGSASEPWSFTAADRGPGAVLRGRSGEGGWFELGEEVRCRALYGRFARRRLAAISFERAGVSLGTLGDGGGHVQTSVAHELEGAGVEAAFDERGRWRAEAALSGAAGDLTWASRVRAGHARFRSLAEPRRSGPAQALVMSATRDLQPFGVRTLGALWRFRPGVGGARGAVELEVRSGPHGTWDVGFEEQQGVRRDLEAGSSARPAAPRQGWWWEWRGGPRETRLTLRHEAWGTRSWVRDRVRVVTTARVEAITFGRILVGITHAVYRTRRGENLYLPEAQSDRLVLRALSGAGQRTRVELALPAAGGSLRASVNLSRQDARGQPSRWSLEWTRRSRLGRRR